MAAGLRALVAALLLAGARGARRPHRAAAAVLAAAGARGVRAEGFGAEGLPEATRKEFKRLDADGDRRLDLEEYLGTARGNLELMEGVDAAQEQKILKFYTKLFADSDVDDDGFLVAREFDLAELIHEWTAGNRLHARLSQLSGPLISQQMKHEFAYHFDIDDSGAVYTDDLVTDTDLNGDGVIQKDEYLAAMRDTAVESWKWGGYLDDPDLVAWLDGLWERSDITGDGILNAKEVQYTAFVAQRETGEGLFEDKTLASTVFEEMDINKDGVIDKGEATGVWEQIEGDIDLLHKIKQTGRGVDGDMPRDRFTEADMNGDDVLDRAEVLALASAMLNDLKEAEAKLKDHPRAFHK